jgi:hypothetical protein
VTALRLWDSPSRVEKPLGPRHGGNVRRVAVAPDDRPVAVGGTAQGVELWDVDSRAVRMQSPLIVRCKRSILPLLCGQ